MQIWKFTQSNSWINFWKVDFGNDFVKRSAKLSWFQSERMRCLRAAECEFESESEREKWKWKEKSRGCSRSTPFDDDGHVASMDKCVTSLYQEEKRTGHEEQLKAILVNLLLVNSTFRLDLSIMIISILNLNYKQNKTKWPNPNLGKI